MEKFLFMGSKGGAGRTTSSLLFAAGASVLGLRPLHIQVMTSGRDPVLRAVRGIPFETESVAASEGALAAGEIHCHVMRHPACHPVIVDMPAERIRGPLVTEEGVRVLLPMQGGVLEIEWVAHDYRDVREAYARKLRHDLRPDQQRLPAWLLPIGWPLGLGPGDYANILERRCSAQDGIGPVPVIRPGVRCLDRFGLAFNDGRGRFRMSAEQQDAAVEMASAVLSQSEGAWQG